jgi:hypothetical protein
MTGSPYPYSLLPQDATGADRIAKIPLGEDVEIQIMRGRSLPQHRLFWAILRHVAEATRWESAERLLVALKLRLGRYDLMKMPNGKVVPVPDSIAFRAMTQDQFQQFMDQSIALICSEVLPGMDSERLIAEAQCGLH